MINMIIQDVVVRGRGLGTRLGYPTANLAHRHRIPSGVWVVLARVQPCHAAAKVMTGLNPVKKGLLVVGAFRRPDRKMAEEVHILDFKGNLYGKNITLTVVKRLRGIQKFKNDMALKKRIQKDIAYVHRHY